MTRTPQVTETQYVSYPTIPSSSGAEEAELHVATSSAIVTEESQPENQPPASDEETRKWGTHIMGPAAAPNVHPENQTSCPLEFKTGSSVPQVAWGKVNLTAKAITEGGFESLFKQIFETGPDEKLMKTFACYLSTSTGPVSGTLYLSTVRVAFCSDRPLWYTAPSGQEAWSYYKVMIPLEKIRTVNPVIMKESPPQKYIQIVTIDGHEFWFMGFVNFEKASHHLLDNVSNFREAVCKSARC
ncbi:hypothetical protein OIU78_013459 [Salix suchowensis]|nr:hypothetical protein OIU78_013459 [Salix suchowensis]